MTCTVVPHFHREVHGPILKDSNAGPVSNLHTKNMFGMNVIRKSAGASSVIYRIHIP